MYKVKVKHRYKVEKKVLVGQDMILHYHKPFALNLTGRWIKTGVTIFDKNEEIVSKLLCKECVEDARKRKTNFVEQFGQDGNSSRVSDHSYQVEGFTESFNMFDWGIGKCSSSDRHACWSRNEMLFDVMRKHEYTEKGKHERTKMVFSRVCFDKGCRCSPTKVGVNQFKEKTYEEVRKRCPHKVFEEVTNKIFFDLRRFGNPDIPKKIEKYSGRFTIRGNKPFFWPPFLQGFTDKKEEEVFYVWCTVTEYQQVQLSQERIRKLKEVPIQNWSREKEEPYWYILPFIYQYDFFLKNPDSQVFPMTLDQHYKNHKFCGRTILELYPGGSAIRVLQYKWMTLEQMPRDLDSEWDGYDDPYYDIDEAFIPQFSEGLVGPIVSYWSRVHDTNRK